MRQVTTGSLLLPPGHLAVESPEIFYQLAPDELENSMRDSGEGVLTDSGAIAVNTGEFTGRSPKDRFIVRDVLTESRVCWNDINIPFGQNMFDRLYTKVVDYLERRPIYVRDSTVCADGEHALAVRTIVEKAYQDLFVSNMFLPARDADGGQSGWTILAAPGFHADPQADGTRQHNFSIINFGRRLVLIGGTGYTGEIKKAMFSVLNFLLPFKGVLPMHCAANKGKNGDTALFFGLSGTGKTTLSADPNRALIGDDEHGWSDTGIFNFEGGCYAKTANLCPQKEPQICEAIRKGALLENIGFRNGSNVPDYDDIRRTENTRVSYPIGHIANAVQPSVGAAPKNIFFLTCDAFGVLPPVSRLTREQAMYHFLSGYTAKVAGTEFGINEPQATFSAGFGRAFLPLYATNYAALLGKKLDQSGANVWLVNTGWTGGGYGIGTRISLPVTRRLIQAALGGELDKADFREESSFGLHIPVGVAGIEHELLDPVRAWSDPSAYYEQAAKLKTLFKQNYRQFESE